MAGPKTDSWFTWRIPAFAAVFGVALLLGLNWKHAGEQPQDTLRRPQVIQVFVSDPSALVQLSTVIAYQEGSDHPHSVEELYLNIVPHTQGEDVDWAVVSLRAPIDNGAPAELSYGTEPQVSPERAWVVYGDQASLNADPSVLGTDPLASENAFGHFIGGTASIGPVAISKGGEFFAHLPAMGLQLPPQPGINMMLAPERTGRTQVIDELPSLKLGAKAGSMNPLDYTVTQKNAEPFGLPFSTPNDLTTNAFLELPRSESSLVNYHVDSVSPVNGSLQGLNFAWVGGTIMEPTVSASDPASVQARSNDDFLAGVALAVAAAALIALIQELPRRLRPARARTDDGGTDESEDQAKEGTPDSV